MKFKTVAEFIHALEVEGKKFEHPYYKNNFVEWRGGPGVVAKDTLAAYAFDAWSKVLVHDWQEYQPEPETEEIELEEWLALEGATYFVRWVDKRATLPLKDAFKTGVTRKVKVPK